MIKSYMHNAQNAFVYVRQNTCPGLPRSPMVHDSY